MIDEEDEEETEEPAEDADVGSGPHVYRRGDVVDEVGEDANADVDGHGEPDEAVGGDFFEACSRVEEEDSPDGQFGL